MSSKQMPVRKSATGDKALPVFHVDDWNMLQGFRRELVGWHYTSDMPGSELAAREDRGPSFLSYMERGDFRGPLSNLQTWAAIFNLKINFIITHPKKMPELSVRNAEMNMMIALADPCHAHGWQRQWLNRRLVMMREALGIGHAKMGELMGVKAASIRDHENGSSDYLLPHLFRRVRAMGGVIRFELVECE